jgi:outer membrane protein OmpA-like peptidoglycan-associated protein
MMLAPKVARSPAKPEARSKPEARKPPSLFVSQRAVDDADEAKHRLRRSPFGQVSLTNLSSATQHPPVSVPPIRPTLIQPKLRVGAVDDPLEHEADDIADNVMRMGSPTIAPSAAPPRISRKCAACEEEAASEAPLQVSRKCAACEKEEQEAPLQRKPGKPPTSKSLHGEAPALVHDVLRSPGQPLDPHARGFFEPRLGFDLSRVRIHADRTASESAQSVDALAYTAGSDVAFAAGHYQPQTDSGRRLIAHELAHVLQQSGGDQGYLRRLGDVSKAPAVLGCPIPPSNVPPTNEFVLFPNRGTTLDAAQKAKVGNYVDRYNASRSGAIVRVDGFASEPGDDALNWQLSCNRASAVHDELVHPSAAHTPGLPEGSISVFMQGETAEFGAEAQNRRATLSPPLTGSSQGSPADTGDTGQPPPTTENTTPPPTGGGTPPQPDTGQAQAAPPERPACALNPSCPDDYCLPFPTQQEALDDRASNGEPVLSTISSANAHAEPLFRKYVFNPGPAGDVSAQLAADFTSSRNTRDATQDVAHLLETELRSHPPVFPPGTDRVTVDIDADSTRSALKAQINQLATTGLVYNIPFEAPGLLAGGVGLDQASCQVGANTSGAQADSRSARVKADVFRNPDGTLLITPDINFTVVDTVDFCPGNCGGFFAQHLGKTVLMSRWEASAISGDVPFTVHFPAPSLVGAFDSED